METLRGVVIYKINNAGSKSENLSPFLYRNKSSVIPLYRKGDNPFENKGFDEFDGKEVVLKGSMNNTRFLVEEIELASNITSANK